MATEASELFKNGVPKCLVLKRKWEGPLNMNCTIYVDGKVFDVDVKALLDETADVAELEVQTGSEPVDPTLRGTMIGTAITEYWKGLARINRNSLRH